jgi:hypothetical protein
VPRIATVRPRVCHGSGEAVGSGAGWSLPVVTSPQAGPGLLLREFPMVGPPEPPARSPARSAGAFAGTPPTTHHPHPPQTLDSKPLVSQLFSRIRASGWFSRLLFPPG